MLENINGDIIQQLNAFHFILQYGSISKAASALNKSPSSVSRLMQQLEDQLGIQLFERHAEGIVPTKRGKAFAVHSRDLLGRLENLLVSVRSDEARGAFLSGAVNILINPVSSNFLLPRILPGLHRRHEGIVFDIRPSVGVKAALKTLNVRDCHFAILARDTLSGAMDFRPLYTTPVCLAVPAGSSLPDDVAVNPLSLAGLPFISVSNESGISRYTAAILDGYGVKLASLHYAPSLTVQAAMVRSGMGFALADAVHALSCGTEGIHIVPLGYFPPRAFGIVQPFGVSQPPHVAATIEYLLENAQKLADELLDGLADQ